jgi:hypothetical protein
MKSINTLIRVKKQEIDNKKITISVLEREKDQLNIEIINLKNELIEQQQLIEKNPEFLYSYSNYANENLLRKNKIINRISYISAEIDKISDEVYELFGELKRFEIILDHKKKQKINEENKREAADLDQLIINKFSQN